MPRFRLGVLDQSPIAEGRTPARAVAETLELAQRCEQLGYGRYWLAEHHGDGSFAGPCPELLIARVAGLTQTIRVGAGGVMLMHASALAVAERFRMLETLFPGRIDLGLGRAPGADGVGIAALHPTYGEPDLPQQHFERKLIDLANYLGPDQAQRGFAQPKDAAPPERWLLGSGHESAALAAKHGWAFCHAQFLAGPVGVAAARQYRRDFRPSPWLRAPKLAVSVFIVCAETDAEAERLISSTELWFLRTLKGVSAAFPSPEVALAHTWNPTEMVLRQQLRHLRIHGGPRRVWEQLEQLSEQYETDEFVIITITHDFAARVRSYELLAENFGLAAPA